MTEPVVSVYLIGHTPRPDLTGDLSERFPGVDFDIAGALDGLERSEIPECRPHGYPLETRLRDGARVVVDAAFLEPRLREAIALRRRLAASTGTPVRAHLVLCAGPFPNLEIPVRRSDAASPIIRPFDVGVTKLRRRGLRTLDVLVPFAAQAGPSADKWAAAGFGCRAHVVEEKPHHRTLAEWLSGLTRGTRAQALVFDYVGFPTGALDEVAAAVEAPVFDLGRLALDALERTLGRP